MIASKYIKQVKGLIKALQLVYRCDHHAFWRKVIYVVLQSILPLLNLYVLKLLIDSITIMAAAPSMDGGFDYLGVVAYLIVFCGIFLINRLISTLSGVNNDVMSQRLIDYVSDLLQTQSVRLDMAYYDNPEYHDTFHRAQQEAAFRPIQVLNNFMSLFGSLIAIVGIVVMLASTSWWVIVVMIVAVIPSFVVRILKARQIYYFRRDNTQTYRRTSYYSSLLTHRDFAKEIRTFGLASTFRQRFVELRKKLVQRLLHISRKLAAYDASCAVVETAALFLVVILLVTKSINGVITIGSFVMLFEAFRRGQGYMQSLVGSISGLYDNRLFVNNLFEFLDLEPKIVDASSPLPFPERVKQVEFRDITFRYPDMERNVLCHYNLTAHVGEITRIEGENGFGKTTLLKLLLRLYDTNEGCVLINGVDVRQYAIKDLRRSIGAIFQDYVRFYCTASENIAYGDVEADDVDNRVRRAAQMAGVDKVIETLPQGYDTPLGRMFDNGAELSMGQWQRVALARQLYSDAPILVFDEPTAWMDIPSRERFYQTLDELKRDKVIILIKHV